MYRIEASRSESREWIETIASRSDERLGARLAEMEMRHAEFELRVEKRFAEFELRMEKRFAEFEKRFTEFEQRTDKRFADLEVKMENRFAELMKWSLVYWVGAVGSIAVLARLIR